jgi:hypothetical protein
MIAWYVSIMVYYAGVCKISNLISAVHPQQSRRSLVHVTYEKILPTAGEVIESWDMAIICKSAVWSRHARRQRLAPIPVHIIVAMVM